MTAITDPAAELTTLLQTISTPSGDSGGAWLATNFEVEEWSPEFYQIIFSILQRIDFIQKTLADLKGFEHLSEDMDGHLNSIKNAFTTSGLQNTWANYGSGYVHHSNIAPLRMCSAFLRNHISYPELTEGERLEVIETATELSGWLKEHQIKENDFIREALIEGIDSFVFRMKKLHWLGWRFSLESLKSVVMAYIALESGFIDDGQSLRTRAALKKVEAGLKKVFNTIGISKDIVDRADFALKAYGAMSLVVTGSQGVAGLLS